MNESKVTIGLKVEVSRKREIDQRAKSLGLTTSEYLRTLILKDHESINRLKDYPERLIFKGNVLRIILNLTQELKNITGSRSTATVIVATLKLALDNEK